MDSVKRQLGKKRMKFYILETDADYSVCPVRANFGNRAKRWMVEWTNELKDFVVSWNKAIAFLELWGYFLNLNHVYEYDINWRNCKQNLFQLTKIAVSCWHSSNKKTKKLSPLAEKKRAKSNCCAKIFHKLLRLNEMRQKKSIKNRSAISVPIA